VGFRGSDGGNARRRGESPSAEIPSPVRYSDATVWNRISARFDRQKIVPEWLKTFWRHQWMFVVVVFSLVFKLQLSYQTLGTRLGQVPFLTYLDFCREIADDIYIMDRGEIMHAGPASDLDMPEVRRHLMV
jgi:hypothetical protein